MYVLAKPYTSGATVPHIPGVRTVAQDDSHAVLIVGLDDAADLAQALADSDNALAGVPPRMFSTHEAAENYLRAHRAKVAWQMNQPIHRPDRPPLHLIYREPEESDFIPGAW
jgi:hypothetical protein